MGLEVNDKGSMCKLNGGMLMSNPLLKKLFLSVTTLGLFVCIQSGYSTPLPSTPIESLVNSMEAARQIDIDETIHSNQFKPVVRVIGSIAGPGIVDLKFYEDGIESSEIVGDGVSASAYIKKLNKYITYSKPTKPPVSYPGWPSGPMPSMTDAVLELMTHGDLPAGSSIGLGTDFIQTPASLTNKTPYFEHGYVKTSGISKGATYEYSTTRSGSVSGDIGTAHVSLTTSVMFSSNPWRIMRYDINGHYVKVHAQFVKFKLIGHSTDPINRSEFTFVPPHGATMLSQH
jgi:hypothetical protein